MPETITIDEMKNLIKEEKIKPSRLFGMEILAEDPVVKGLIKEEVGNAVTAEYTHRKRGYKRHEEEEEEFGKEKKKFEDEKKKFEDEIQKLKVENAKKDIGGLFAKIKDERDLSEKQTKFIEPKLKDFEPEKIEDMEKELNSHVDDLIDELKTISKDVFGEESEDEEDKKDKDKKGGGEPYEKKQKVEKGSEDINPETNPFIPTD